MTFFIFPSFLRAYPAWCGPPFPCGTVGSSEVCCLLDTGPVYHDYLFPALLSSAHPCASSAAPARLAPCSLPNFEHGPRRGAPSSPPGVANSCSAVVFGVLVL